jgi:hypothetical protein
VDDLDVQQADRRVRPEAGDRRRAHPDRPDRQADVDVRYHATERGLDVTPFTDQVRERTTFLFR